VHCGERRNGRSYSSGADEPRDRSIEEILVEYEDRATRPCRERKHLQQLFLVIPGRDEVANPESRDDRLEASRRIAPPIAAQATPRKSRLPISTPL
jgi:hypothetical protein